MNEPNNVTVANIELRGYEVARKNPITGGWDQVIAYRPTERGRLQCVASAGWLGERHPKESYAARAIVSLEPKPTDEALHLDADENPESDPAVAE